MQVQVRGQRILKIAGNVLRGSAATDFFMNRHPIVFAKHCSGVAPGRKSSTGCSNCWKEKTIEARAIDERLQQHGSITDPQFDEFVSNGAIGSHLENLQRKGGFKGPNQHAVSIIIAETDPRLQGAFWRPARGQMASFSSTARTPTNGPSKSTHDGSNNIKARTG